MKKNFKKILLLKFPDSKIIVIELECFRLYLFISKDKHFLYSPPIDRQILTSIFRIEKTTLSGIHFARNLNPNKKGKC